METQTLVVFHTDDSSNSSNLEGQWQIVVIQCTDTDSIHPSRVDTVAGATAKPSRNPESKVGKPSIQGIVAEPIRIIRITHVETQLRKNTSDDKKEPKKALGRNNERTGNHKRHIAGRNVIGSKCGIE